MTNHVGKSAGERGDGGFREIYAQHVLIGQDIGESRDRGQSFGAKRAGFGERIQRLLLQALGFELDRFDPVAEGLLRTSRIGMMVSSRQARTLSSSILTSSADNCRSSEASQSRNSSRLTSTP
jgi:hypothetical protein